MDGKEYRNLFDEIGWEEQRNRRIIGLIESDMNIIKSLGDKGRALDNFLNDALARAAFKTIAMIWDEWEAGNVSNGEWNYRTVRGRRL